MRILCAGSFLVGCAHRTLRLFMEKHYLESIFGPASVAVMCDRDYCGIGNQVLHNLRQSGFGGDVYAVMPECAEDVAVKTCSSLSELGRPVELAVIAARAASQPALLRACGAHKVAAVIVLSGGFSETQAHGLALQNELVDIARSFNIALVGPRCLGIVRPLNKLNVSSARSPVAPGKVALVTQSGAFCSSLLDWADSIGFGFSAVASLGATSAVKMGDVLDYLAQDPHTNSILLYVERITNARLFLSGLRAAARLKPVVVIKSGRNPAGERAALAHIHTPLGSDAVFDAAIRRAGAVRVTMVSQLLAAATILATGARVKGPQLAVLTNGGGPGVMAADWAGSQGVPLAELSPQTLEALSAVLPGHWSHCDPVDILGDADGERYRAATAIILADPNVDGLLVLCTPQGFTDTEACAQGVIDGARGSRKPVLASWMGERLVAAGRKLLVDAGIPHFIAPEGGVDAFAYLASYRRNQIALLQVPEPLSENNSPDVGLAQGIVDRALAQGRERLDPQQAHAILSAFNIPLLPANDSQPSPAMVVAITRDPVFGPVIHLGAAGMDIEQLAADCEVALPPLNDFLSRELIARADVSRLWGRGDEDTAASVAQLSELLQRLSEIACELPAIGSVHIPLWVNEKAIAAADARIAVKAPVGSTVRYGHMAIHPYPANLESHITLADGLEVLVRPIRPEDARKEQDFVSNLSAQSKYFRFMHGLNKLTPEMLARFTQIDYDREMALVALAPGDDARPTFVGVARYIINPDGNSCEFALTVADAWQSRGVGPKMMQRLMEIARDRGLDTMVGEVLAQNSRMLRMCKRLGFIAERSREDAEIIVVSRAL